MTTSSKTRDTYWVSDLDDTFTTTFARKNIIGGEKGAWHPNIETDSDWIIHARYLLSIVSAEHMDLMLSVGEGPIYGGELEFKSLHTPCAAAWMAGLLKDTRFIERIGKLAAKRGNMYFSCAYFASLLLYDDPVVSSIYQRQLYSDDPNTLNEDWDDSGPLALYCLEVLDKRYVQTHVADAALDMTQLADKLVDNQPALYHLQVLNERHGRPRVADNSAVSLPPFKPGMRLLAEKLVENILYWSRILRAGIVFNMPEQLQEQLKTLLQDTTTVDEYMRGLLHHKPIRRVNIQAMKEFRSAADRLRADCIQQYKTTGLADLPQTPFCSTPHGVKFPPDTSKSASAAARSFLAAADSQETLMQLQAEVERTENFVDIVRIIDLDVHNQIPSDVIIGCFKRLLKLIPHSFDLYEQYSMALLLRGKAHDAFAQDLWEKAQAIKVHYEWAQEKHYRYVMLPASNEFSLRAMDQSSSHFVWAGILIGGGHSKRFAGNTLVVGKGLNFSGIPKCLDPYDLEWLDFHDVHAPINSWEFLSSQSGLKRLTGLGTHLGDKTARRLFEEQFLPILAHLDSLEELDCSYTAFKTEWLSYLPKSGRLKKLYLANGDIAAIPEQIAETMRPIEVLDLNENPLIGGFGLMYLDKLKNLRRFRHRRNPFTEIGGLSSGDLIHFLDLPALCELSISGVTDLGLKILSQIPSLHSLDLWGARIGDNVAPYFKAFRRLEKLLLGETAVGDATMEALINHPEMRVLDIRATRVSEEGLSSIAQLENLETLGLNPENIMPLMIEISRLSSLRELNLVDVADEALAPLCGHGLLEKVNILGGKEVTDKGVEYLGRIPNLRSLDVQFTSMTHRGLAHLESVPKLEELHYIAHSPEDFKQLGRLKTLRVLNLRSWHRITLVEAIEFLTDLTALEYLVIDGISQDPLDERAVSALSKFRNLKHLSVRSQKKPDDLLRRLRESLPYCIVELSSCPGMPRKQLW